jgi:hypothetical protein
LKTVRLSVGSEECVPPRSFITGALQADEFAARQKKWHKGRILHTGAGNPRLI